MSLIQVGIDDEALQAAIRLSGSRTREEAVNLALKEYAARHQRIEALEHFAGLSENWDYGGWAESRKAERDLS